MMAELKHYPKEVVKANIYLFRKALNCQRQVWYRAHEYGVRVDKIVPYLFGLMMDAKSCYYCGKPFTNHNQMTLDHIIPLSRGGGHVIGNIAVCCRHCDQLKGNMSKVEYMRVVRSWREIAEVSA